MFKKRWAKIRDSVNTFFTPRPSLFDLCACIGIIPIGFLVFAIRGFYIECFTVFLTMMAFYVKEKRSFKSPAMTILGIMALSGLFWHSFIYSTKSITYTYLNFYLMHEGFAYIFFSLLLFYILVTRSTNLRLLYLTIPIASIEWINTIFHGKQMSIFFALLIGFIIYLALDGKYRKISFIMIGLTVLSIISNLHWVIFKFRCRPPLWKDMFLSMIQHPIMGSGFSHLIVHSDFTMSTSWGNTWLFKQNDYLNLGNIFGVFIFIPLTMLIKQIFDIVKKSLFLVPFIGIVLLCFVQITMPYPDKALVIISLMALSCVENLREVEYEKNWC